MGRLFKTVLGKASGKVGDFVFRIVDGKVIIASHIGTNEISKSPECVNNRKRFAAVLNFASAVNKIPDLKIIWNKSRKSAKSGYNKIISVNTKLVEDYQISKQNIVTPDGFSLFNLDAVLTAQNAVVSFSLSDDSVIYSGKKFNACLVITLSNPVSKLNKTSFSFSNVVPDVVVDSTVSVVSFSLKNQKKIIDKYRKAIVFFALSNTEQNKPLCSDSFAFEFNFKK
ncbi:MAG: hypothetical protein WC139_07655 [Candidatus Kapaibacterium sp.]